MAKWYNNLCAFKLNTDIKKSDIEKVEDNLIPKMGEVDREVSGWDYVLEDSDVFVEVGNAFMLKIRVDKKTIPASALKNKVKERIKQLEAEGNEKPNKKAVKEQVEAELMKHAFVTSKEILGYVDTKHKYVVINSNSASDIDRFNDMLRETIGDYDIDPIELDFDITETLTNWLVEKNAKEPFELGEDCTLNDSLSGSKATLARQDLSSDEIDILIKSGKKVSELSLNWEERVTFNLTNEFKIKKVKPQSVIGELLQEEIGEDESEYTAYVTSMLIMVEDFAQILADLLKEE